MTDPRHKPFDEEISVRGIAGFGIGVLVVSVLAMFAMWAMNMGLERRHESAQPEPRPLARDETEHLPPAPNLQTIPELDYQTFLHEQEADLQTYRLLDPNAGTVQIPIDDAIERIVQDGAPRWEADATEGG